MPLRNVLLSQVNEIGTSYLDSIIEEGVSEWHLTVGSKYLKELFVLKIFTLVSDWFKSSRRNVILLYRGLLIRYHFFVAF